MSDTRKTSTEIESDVEKTRSKIDATINEIKDRFSTDTAVDYGVTYMRGEGGRNLLTAVRDNPLAAMLMLAGASWLAYTASQPEEERRRRLRERRDSRHSLAERMSDGRTATENERVRQREMFPEVLPASASGTSAISVASATTPMSGSPKPGAGEPPFGSSSIDAAGFQATAGSVSTSGLDNDVSSSTGSISKSSSKVRVFGADETTTSAAATSFDPTSAGPDTSSTTYRDNKTS